MLASVCLASLALVAPSNRGDDQPRLLDTLPGDAVCAVVIEDFATLWERVRGSSWGKVASDPALRPFWSWLDGHLQSELGDDGITWMGALGALQGAALFAGSTDDEGATGYVLRLRPDIPEASTLRAYLEGSREPVEIDGRRFVAGRGGRSGSWEVAFSSPAGIAVIDVRERENALRLAASVARVLDSEAAGGALSERLTEPRPAQSTLEVYVDVGSLIASSLPMRAERERRTFEALDLDDFGWATIRLSLGDDSALDLDAKLEMPRAGLWPLLASHARPVPVRLARFAPADAIEVSALGYDVQGAWHSLRAWLERELPDTAHQLDRGLESLQGIDLEQELIAQLSGEFAQFLIPLADDERAAFNGFAASVMLGLLSTPGSTAASVYVVAVEDVAVVEKLFGKLIELSGEAERVVEEEFAGRTVRSFAVPELSMRPTWAFADGVFVVSLYRSAVRSVLRQASDDPLPGWLNADRRKALLAGGSAIGSSVADLQQLAQVRYVGPLVTLSGLVNRLPVQSDGSETDRETIAEIAGVLSGLVEKYVSGTARTTLAIEGRTLRYRCWTDE